MRHSSPKRSRRPKRRSLRITKKRNDSDARSKKLKLARFFAPSPLSLSLSLSLSTRTPADLPLACLKSHLPSTLFLHWLCCHNNLSRPAPPSLYFIFPSSPSSSHMCVPVCLSVCLLSVCLSVCRPHVRTSESGSAGCRGCRCGWRWEPEAVANARSNGGRRGDGSHNNC